MSPAHFRWILLLNAYAHGWAVISHANMDLFITRMSRCVLCGRDSSVEAVQVTFAYLAPSSPDMFCATTMSVSSPVRPLCRGGITRKNIGEYCGCVTRCRGLLALCFLSILSPTSHFSAFRLQRSHIPASDAQDSLKERFATTQLVTNRHYIASTQRTSNLCEKY